MAIDIDPEGRETAAVLAAAPLHGARVLEIGCGSGRLTRRCAAFARRTVGVDGSVEGLRAAAATSRGGTAYVQSSALALPFPPASFDVALFGWSL